MFGRRHLDAYAVRIPPPTTGGFSMPQTVGLLIHMCPNAGDTFPEKWRKVRRVFQPICSIVPEGVAFLLCFNDVVVPR